MLKLYGGFTVVGKKLTHEPENPEAVWWIVVNWHDRWAARGLALTRELPDGWEILYSKITRGYTLATTPYTAAELEGAEPNIDLIPHLHHLTTDVAWLIENRPLSARNTTGDPYRASPKVKCCKCGRAAFATLSAYSTGGTTSHVVRNFCKGCLKRGQKLKTDHLICHICRKPGAHRQIFWVAHPGRKGPYEFRVHDECANEIADMTCERPTLEERRPLVRAIVRRS